MLTNCDRFYMAYPKDLQLLINNTLFRKSQLDRARKECCNKTFKQIFKYTDRPTQKRLRGMYQESWKPFEKKNMERR